MPKEMRKPKMMSKQANRGINSTEQGDDYMSKRKPAKISYVEGTEPNKKLPAKSLTPPAKMMKKK